MYLSHLDNVPSLLVLDFVLDADGVTDEVIPHDDDPLVLETSLVLFTRF